MFCAKIEDVLFKSSFSIAFYRDEDNSVCESTCISLLAWKNVYDFIP